MCTKLGRKLQAVSYTHLDVYKRQTLMGLLVAVFSMLTINYEAFANASLTPNYVIAMNLSLTFCIVVMFGLLLLLVNAWKKKWFCVFYAAILLGLGVATILVFLI